MGGGSKCALSANILRLCVLVLLCVWFDNIFVNPSLFVYNWSVFEYRIAGKFRGVKNSFNSRKGGFSE